MSGLGNGKRMFGVGLLTVLMMTAAGCTELMEDTETPTGDFDLYEGDTSTVTLEIYHGESLASATANYSITIQLNHADAPMHADNFRQHALDGNYNNVTFHRIIDDFMIQGGDFTNGDGTGGHAAKWYGICDGDVMNQSDCPSQVYYNVPDEANNGLVHTSCTISMAKTSMPNTGGSQFFLMPDDINQHTWLDGKHTVFGTITSGCEHVTTLSEVAVDGSDRPILPVVIHTATASA